jgi:hypothetical protein
MCPKVSLKKPARRGRKHMIALVTTWPLKTWTGLHGISKVHEQNAVLMLKIMTMMHTLMLMPLILSPIIFISGLGHHDYDASWESIAVFPNPEMKIIGDTRPM